MGERGNKRDQIVTAVVKWKNWQNKKRKKLEQNMFAANISVKGRSLSNQPMAHPHYSWIFFLPSNAPVTSR